MPKGYEKFLGELKERIRTAQLRASVSVNRELVLLYWQIGRDILARQKEHGWGAKVIDRLAGDLRREFPGIEGFSPRNLKYMRAFALAWPEEAIVQQAAAQIPWFHNCVLLDKVKDQSEREWYVQETINNGWSRNVLVPIRHALQQTVRRNRVVSHRDPHDTLIAHSDGLATWEPNYFVVGAAQRGAVRSLAPGLVLALAGLEAQPEPAVGRTQTSQCGGIMWVQRGARWQR